jgi:NAD(P)-dependent dehydrogenase (short-subunit alcohol dehydrogenase family)
MDAQLIMGGTIVGKLKNRVALVTGAAGGIGSEIARHLAAEDAIVVLSDINVPGAEAIAQEIGRGSSTVAFDAYDADSIFAMVQTTIDRHGRLDILINNAADTSLTYADRTVLDTEIETFDKSIRSNLRAVFIATKAALPHLIESKGAIVNISSTGGLVGDSWLISYNAAKAGVISLTKNTAVQYGKQGVRCNSICPGFIAHGKAREMMKDTLKSALDASYVTRNGDPADIAALATFLASDAAGFINGENIVCDGGWTVGVAPWRTGDPQPVGE